MTIDDATLCRLPLAETVFFPLSGNPPGFNHLAAAEWLLRAGRGWKRVVFVLSNGHHPDPHKPAAERDAASRLALLESMIAEVGDPRRCLLARHAADAGERLRIGPETLAVSDTEFHVSRAVRTVETVERILRDRPADAGRVLWFVGSDLVRRMADPAIFDDADLQTLAQCCHFAILERPGEPVGPALAMLKEYRGVMPAHTVLPTREMPEFLATYLELSSTRIRHAAEAGDPIGGMVTRTAATTIEKDGWYRAGRVVLRRVDLEGHEMGCRTRLQLDLEALQIELDATSARVAELLVERREHGLPHGLSVAETSAGGFLTATLAGRAGASRYFRQGRFAYDQVAKDALIPEGRRVDSSVSAEMVSALAEGMAAQAHTEFALTESGMAGPPDPRRRSLKSGMSWIAMITPEGTSAESLQLNPFLTRKEHQYGFATHALSMLERWLLAHRP